MTAIADRAGESLGPNPDPGIDRVRGGTESRFYAGLAALAVLLIFGTLAAIAVLPLVVPGYIATAISSGSMLPNLRPGDVVIAATPGDEGIEAGMIIVYEDPKQHDLVTHRVVAINDDGSYVTKGDASGTDDRSAIPEVNVRGVGRWVVPYVGLPRVWLAHGQWNYLAVAVAIFALLLWLVRYGIDPRHDPWTKAAPSDADGSS